MTTRLLEIATQSLTGEVCPERPRRGGIGERFRQNHTLPLSVSPVEGETDISSSQRSDKTTPLPILLFWVFKLPYGPPHFTPDNAPGAGPESHFPPAYASKWCP